MITEYVDEVTGRPRRHTDDASSRCRYLIDLHHMRYAERDRVRRIMNGGREASVALLGRAPSRGEVPFANLMLSGITRLAQRIGRAPDLRIDAGLDSERGRKNAELRERIVARYDQCAKLHMQLPQAGRWLPGYGIVPWVVEERRDKSGFVYPHAQLRDPFDCFADVFGVDQQPEDVCFVRRIPVKVLLDRYPQHAKALGEVERAGNGPVTWGSTTSSGSTWQPGGRWENSSQTGLEVCEYLDEFGRYLLLPEKRLCLEFAPNVSGRRQFHVAKLFSFDSPVGQYDHIIGLMAAMAKLHVLAFAVMEKAAFSPTIVAGELDGPWREGPNAINQVSAGTQVSRLPMNLPYQYFQEGDRLESMLRIVAGYPASEDGKSPTSFATGRGVEELRGGVDQAEREMQTIFRDALEELDAIRLAVDEKANGSRSIPLVGYHKGQTFDERYVPSRHINGKYATRRVYGMMAGWDEPSKLVGGLQLMQAKVISTTTVQENIDGLENISREQERIRAEGAEAALFAALLQQANAGEPKAVMAAVKLLPRGELRNVMEQFYTPEGDEMTPEQQAMAGMLPPEGPPPGPPNVQDVMARLMGPQGPPQGAPQGMPIPA